MTSVRRPGAMWIILAVYIGLALAVTFPFVLHPQSTLTAPLSGDVSGSISKFQTLVAEHQNPFGTVHLRTIGYPAGVTTQPGVDRTAFLNTGILWVSSIVIGAIAAHGLLTLLGFILTAVITFLFVRRVTGSNGAGFIAGLAYGFWGHMYLIAAAAPTYTHMWMLLLPIWGWYELALRPTLGGAVLAGLAPLPAIFWTPYFALHVAVVTAACVLAVIVRGLVLRQVGIRAVVFGGLALALPIAGGVATVVLLTLSGHSGVPVRPLEDAFQESAHPLMYLLPGYASSWGPSPYHLLVRLVPRAEHSNSYLGISVIAISMVAVATAIAGSTRKGAALLASPQVLATLMATAVVILCFLFSLPPRIAGSGLPMPDALVIAVQPAFRAGQRFVMPLMAGMSILAGIGAGTILRRVASARVALALAVALALVVGLDNFARPTDGITGRPEAVTRMPRSTALAALARQPQGPAYEFVDRTRTSRLSEITPCLLQPQHGKILVNSCLIVPENSDAQRWAAFRDCGTLADMRTAGVRYVIVDASMSAILACLKGPMAASDQEIATDELVAVYKLG